MYVIKIVSMIIYLGGVSAIYYDTYSGKRISQARVEDLRRNNLIPFCGRDVAPCDAKQPRRADGSCNNLHMPVRGAPITPYHRELLPEYSTGGGLRVAKSGRPLPNVRRLRVAVMPDGRIGSKTFTHLVSNTAVFITGDSTSVHDIINYVLTTPTCCTPAAPAERMCMPIIVPDDDVHLRMSNVRCLNMTRAITYQVLQCIPDTIPPERINTNTPMLDLTQVYGASQEAEDRVREFRGGRLRFEILEGRQWPPGNGPGCINNQPPLETRCHESAIVNSNALMGVNLLYILLFRNHNWIAQQLEAMNPCWTDQDIWLVAKEINIGMYQNILYYEFMATIIGTEYLLNNKVLFHTDGYVDDYDPSLEPRVSLDQVIGSRWFHSTQEGRTKLYDPEGKVYGELNIVDLTLRTGILPVNGTISGLTQGSFRQSCGESDYLVDPDMGERVLGPSQLVSDVVSSDIIKGRDAGLPGYNSYRKRCGLPIAKNFEDLYEWMPVEQVDAIKLLYEDVEDIDLMVGILSEKLMAGAIMGPTLICLTTLQLLRWRRSDRFFYENSVHPGAFTLDQLREVRKATMARLLCDHGDSVTEIQPQAYLLPTKGNKITDCKNILAPTFEPWRATCEWRSSKEGYGGPSRDRVNPYSDYTDYYSRNIHYHQHSEDYNTNYDASNRIVVINDDHARKGQTYVNNAVLDEDSSNNKFR